MSIPKKITTSGNVFIKYRDDESIQAAKIGDILLYMNDDSTSIIVGNYEATTVSGYIKAKIFDGKFWQHIDISEFCTDNENKFAKRQKPIDTAYLCKAIIEGKVNTDLFKTYRGHFSIDEYIPDPYARRHPKWNKIKKRNLS